MTQDMVTAFQTSKTEVVRKCINQIKGMSIVFTALEKRNQHNLDLPMHCNLKRLVITNIIYVNRSVDKYVNVNINVCSSLYTFLFGPVYSVRVHVWLSLVTRHATRRVKVKRRGKKSSALLTIRYSLSF